MGDVPSGGEDGFWHLLEELVDYVYVVYGQVFYDAYVSYPEGPSADAPRVSENHVAYLSFRYYFHPFSDGGIEAFHKADGEVYALSLGGLDEACCFFDGVSHRLLH